ncbi:kinase-like domain-containing protein [Podospora appendiculata]|uniref:Kinase-like domain-containing protein n=1 Tax=Podospora appendiculata TaxID=314037 RepID=A0AAE1CAS5_9PEZI|nr:kinase-like domain-containing protein [Podospora appendiculata]
MSMLSTSPPSALLSPTPLPAKLEEDEGDDQDCSRGACSSAVDAAAARDRDGDRVSKAQLLANQNARSHSHSAIELSSPPATTDLLTYSEGSRTSPTLSTPQRPPHQIQFRSHTIAPSPPLPRSSSSSSSTSASAFTPASAPASSSASPQQNSSEASAEHSQLAAHYDSAGGVTLRLQTDLCSALPTATDASHLFTTPSKRGGLRSKSSASSLKPISRTPSLKFAHAFSSSAASSTVTSPVISAMGELTPLPSPLLSSDSPGPWRRLGRRPSRDAPHFQPSPSGTETSIGTGDSIAIGVAAPNQSKRKAYAGLVSGLANGNHDSEQAKTHSHARNRSISDYTPDPMGIPKRMASVSAVSGTHLKVDVKTVGGGYQNHMRREPHLSEARGLTPIEKPPTPPPSESSLSVNETSPVNGSVSGISSSARHEYFEAKGRNDMKRRRWRALKMLGQGTFSRVMLATSQIPSSLSDNDEYPSTTGLQTPESLNRYDRRTLVAVKVCEHGPCGGASEDRIEMSLKRELELMQCIHHPSLVHLKAWNIEPTRAILVLSYYPGGDLFDVASQHREVLSPSLLRRMFAELVGAVRYLHERRIVHRDIKLENVLVNLPPAELASPTTDWALYPYSVITLTDLGLSRRITDDEKLETRCGSDDYAAPEVIMGQPYDGRAIDAWSLGVLLYALLEGRLPFDPPPGIGDHAMQMRMRSRTSHRIARVEWRWIEYGVRAGEEGYGDHEADLSRFEGKGLIGAMEVVEGLLKRARTRWPLAQVAETKWVRGGVQVEKIQFREEEEGEEVL